MSQLALLIEDDSKLLLFFVLFDLQSLLEPWIKKSNKSRLDLDLHTELSSFTPCFIPSAILLFSSSRIPVSG